VSDSGLLTLAL